MNANAISLWSETVVTETNANEIMLKMLERDLRANRKRLDVSAFAARGRSNRVLPA
jgi:hypothetical protein